MSEWFVVVSTSPEYESLAKSIHRMLFATRNYSISALHIPAFLRACLTSSGRWLYSATVISLERANTVSGLGATPGASSTSMDATDASRTGDMIIGARAGVA